MHGEIAHEHVLPVLLFDLLALERDGRVFLNVKKVRAAKMLITSGDAGIDAFRLNSSLCLVDFLAVHNDCAAEFVEFAMDSINDHMTDAKSNAGMHRVNVVSICGDRPR